MTIYPNFIGKQTYSEYDKENSQQIYYLNVHKLQ